ncbi:MAG: DUF3592 domain-containing protein, partial [Pseudobdellovibrionaceae bacterium]
FTTGSAGKSKQFNFYSVARFQNFDEQTYYAVSSTGSSAPLNFIGDQVYVYVQKKDPSIAAIQSNAAYVIGTILAGLGVGCIVLFVRLFEMTTFSIVSSIVILGFVARGLWKIRRKTPLTPKQWMELKKKNNGKKVFSEEEREQIPWVSPESITVAAEKAKKTCQVAIPVTFVISLICVGASWYYYQKIEKFLADSVSTQGIVVEMVQSQSAKSSSYAPIVEFVSPNTPGARRFKHSISMSPPAYSVGESVRVRFDPKNPSNARIDSGIWNYLSSIVLGGLGTLLGLITWHNMRTLDRYNNPGRRRPQMLRRPSQSA